MRENNRYVEAVTALRRDTVLDAVGALLAEQRWNDVSMNEIATAAGVSRQTIYNSFGNRQGLAGAYVLREAERFLNTVTEAVEANPTDPRHALFMALRIFLAAAETHPLVRVVADSDAADELLPLLTSRGAPVLELITVRLAALLSSTWPAVERRHTEPLSDCLVRLAISHAALRTATPEVTAGQIAAILGPYLEQLIREASRPTAPPPPRRPQ